MTFQDILYIVTIAENGSITKAAAKIFVAQPALSQCLHKVENEIGHIIFERTCNGVVPTEAGMCFIDFAKKVLKEKEIMESRLVDLSNAVCGTVRIGFTGLQMAYMLPRFFMKFKTMYPKVEVYLAQGLSEYIENEVIKGNLDIAVLHPPLNTKKLDIFLFDQDEMVVVPRSDSDYHRYVYYNEDDGRPYIDLNFFRTEPLILTASTTRSRQTCDRILERAKITPRITQVTDNLASIDALAQIDYATAILPHKQLSDALQKRAYFYIDSKYEPEYPFYIVVSKDAYRTNAMACLLELLRSNRGAI